jgi:hypothetical protein
MQPKLLTTYASLTPLTVILARLNVDPAYNFTVELMEENENPYKLTVAVDEASAGTTVYFTDYGTSLVRDTVLFNPRTKDIRYVNDDPADDDGAVTVAISQGGTTSSAWKTGDTVYAQLRALVENDSSAGGTQRWRCSSVQDSRVYNLTQLYKLQFKLTRTLNQMTTHFGGPGSIREALKRKKYREMRIKKELNLYFGGRATSGTAPATQRMNNGLFGVLYNGSNFTNFNNAFTESAWDAAVGDYVDANPDVSTVDAFIAPNVKRQITYWAKDKIRISPDSTRYGLKIDQYIGADVPVNLIPLRLLTDTETKGWGWFLDLNYITMKPLENDEFIPEALNAGQSEEIVDTYRGSHSLLIGSETRHKMFVGATH